MNRYELQELIDLNEKSNALHGLSHLVYVLPETDRRKRLLNSLIEKEKNLILAGLENILLSNAD